MPRPLPELYFRIRENGAAVFRVDTDNPQRRIEMQQIAVVNVKNGEIRPHGERDLSEAERAQIETWLAERQALLAARDARTPLRTVEQLNLAAQWAQARASDEELEATTEALLMAMHDLRSILVRKKAERGGLS